MVFGFNDSRSVHGRDSVQRSSVTGSMESEEFSDDREFFSRGHGIKSTSNKKLPTMKKKKKKKSGMSDLDNCILNKSSDTVSSRKMKRSSTSNFALALATKTTLPHADVPPPPSIQSPDCIAFDDHQTFHETNVEDDQQIDRFRLEEDAAEIPPPPLYPLQSPHSVSLMDALEAGGRVINTDPAAASTTSSLTSFGNTKKREGSIRSLMSNVNSSNGGGSSVGTLQWRNRPAKRRTLADDFASFAGISLAGSSSVNTTAGQSLHSNTVSQELLAKFLLTVGMGKREADELALRFAQEQQQQGDAISVADSSSAGSLLMERLNAHQWSPRNVATLESVLESSVCMERGMEGSTLILKRSPTQSDDDKDVESGLMSYQMPRECSPARSVDDDIISQSSDEEELQTTPRGKYQAVILSLAVLLVIVVPTTVIIYLACS